MSEVVHTYADIIISPYAYEEILELKITKELNEHGKLYISGIIPEEKVDEYVENADDSEQVEVLVRDGDKTITVFQGFVTNLAVQATSNVRIMTVEALSSTFLMDVKKKSRSFQNSGATYSSIFTNITSKYSNSQGIDEASNGKTIGGLLVQYKETDWEFIKRLASHFNAPLVPAVAAKGLKYYIGVPELGEKCTLEEFNYSIKKDLKGYKIKSENDIQGIDEQNLISYEITTNRILELCSTVQFKQRNLYVFKAETEMKEGVLLNKYTLRDKKGLSRRKIYNHLLIGASLFGNIEDVAKDTVKVNLEIDGAQSSGEMWFPYSTVYSSSDGSGWYCMPEIGDKVRLYFPDENEKNAFVASSVNVESSQRSDPSVKSISTKYGKQIVFQPGAVEIVGNGQTLMRLTDDGGIEINSDKKITLSASDDIEINGGGKVLIQGGAGIDLKQAGTSLNIKDDVTLSGGKVNIQ
ncbi:phage baseplate assembly protein V [Clostridium sp. DJ247]|uniref:phage baseplate assembly protein V n=1 Tax=Clostridium sp. DJ247 TaxID=2726188 RepID=UPI001627DF68|nr:phage baseplate assembly protein V [Clostridium sp. DJ247]MBC2580544.1 phage tail protein [Clostridium sp. DJ247]